MQQLPTLTFISLQLLQLNFKMAQSALEGIMLCEKCTMGYAEICCFSRMCLFNQLPSVGGEQCRNDINFNAFWQSFCREFWAVPNRKWNKFIKVGHYSGQPTCQHSHDIVAARAYICEKARPLFSLTGTNGSWKQIKRQKQTWADKPYLSFISQFSFLFFFHFTGETDCPGNQQWHRMSTERFRLSVLLSYLTQVRVKAMTMQYGGSAVQRRTFQMDKRGPEARWLRLSWVCQTPIPLKPRRGREVLSQ